MRKNLRGLSMMAAAVLLPIACLALYLGILLPDGAFVLPQGNASVLALPKSAQVGNSSDAPVGQPYRLFGIIPIKSVTATVQQRRYVIPGGQIFGLKLYAKGVVVVAVDGVAGEHGKENPAAAADLRPGDLVVEIDGQTVLRNSEVQEAIADSGGKTLQLKVERDGDSRKTDLTPVKCSDGSYKAGLWVRDSSAGIGTVTFQDPQTGMLAGLGHAVCDVDSGVAIPISAGEAVPATVKGYYKSSGGKPGELCGVFDGEAYAGLLQNGDTGVYGKLYSTAHSEQIRLPVALRQEVKVGKAQIMATIDGGAPRSYEAEIKKVFPLSGGSKKNMIVQITDSELIAQTGGIVQGMSGSPILQDGLLVGAVTHVFVNNPLQGYGIFAQTMLETADELNNAQ
ncbi:MAG: SpoIVB peptidase [Oscillospiraceae bacterium]|jgi:stage IV sporulation protein B|nr:SpoIVB peptidase [Oscillospiraceae bacterium]